MQNEPLEVTLKVTGIFEKLGIPYLIAGSLASSLHGVMRSTLDVDIVADVQLEHAPPLVEALSNGRDALRLDQGARNDMFER